MKPSTTIPPELAVKHGILVHAQHGQKSAMFGRVYCYCGRTFWRHEFDKHLRQVQIRVAAPTRLQQRVDLLISVIAKIAQRVECFQGRHIFKGRMTIVHSRTKPTRIQYIQVQCIACGAYDKR